MTRTPTQQQGPQMPSPQQQQMPMHQPALGTQMQLQGLAPTGLQQQLNSLNQLYANVQHAQAEGPAGMGGFGYDVRGLQNQEARAGGTNVLAPDMQMGSSSLDQMAKNMAQRYGLPIGRGRLVDEYGNFLMTPKQLADASGGQVTMGEAAAQMNYISQALTRKQNEEQQAKGIAAMQAGMGQIQSRGRGSLASIMSGQYTALADLYANQEYESADFSYYIQKEQLDIQTELQRRYEKMVKKQARGQAIGGVAMAAVGLMTGNAALIGQGVGMTASSVGQTGWF